MTEDAKLLINAVNDINKSRKCNLTIIYLAEIYKGCCIKKIRDAGKLIAIIYKKNMKY